VVTAKSFEEVVMDDTKDVLVMFHATSCESCSHFSVYYKRMAQRFSDLQIESLVVARMDVSHEAPPGDLNLLVSALPLVVLIPANDKAPPWLYYSGVSKVQTMMRWVEEYASVPFTLPNLPHLSDSDVVLYKEQVREREVHMAEKREQDQAAMEEETLKQEAFKLKNQQKNEPVDTTIYTAVPQDEIRNENDDGEL
jgi:protein disulfide-isomerase A1